MKPPALRLLTAVIALALILPASAKVKIRTQREKAFDFKTVRTYAWHPSGAGDVKVLQATADKPETIQAMLEPTIREAVEQGLAARGLQPLASDRADVYVNYYLLIGPNTSSQYMGQFIGNAPEWGLPPFAAATTSLKVYEQGSLVLDVASRLEKSVIWRGVAQAEIDRQRTVSQRDERVREAVRSMLQKFPSVK
jgi:hypothetical protein